jgi:hypothetical protein
MRIGRRDHFDRSAQETLQVLALEQVVRDKRRRRDRRDRVLTQFVDGHRPDCTRPGLSVARSEFLSGTEAPAALREAQARVNRLRGETDDGPQISPAVGDACGAGLVQLLA